MEEGGKYMKTHKYMYNTEEDPQSAQIRTIIQLDGLVMLCLIRLCIYLYASVSTMMPEYIPYQMPFVTPCRTRQKLVLRMRHFLFLNLYSAHLIPLQKRLIFTPSIWVQALYQRHDSLLFKRELFQLDCIQHIGRHSRVLQRRVSQ